MMIPPEQKKPDGHASQSVLRFKAVWLPTVPSGHLVGAEEPAGQKELSGQSGG